MSQRTFFHCCDSGADPGELLDPVNQLSEPWGGAEHGSCDKCGGNGAALYECRSCLEGGREPDCPACQGRVRYRDTCPACLGSGQIGRTRRAGVAVFPRREGLYRYLAEKDAEVGGKLLVELAGELSAEPDLDADSGALLLFPHRVVAATPLDPELVEAIRARRD